MFITIVALTLSAAPPQLSLDHGISLSQRGDHESSQNILQSIRSRSIRHEFYLLVNDYKLNRKKEAMRRADEIINSFDQIPTRYRDLALIMKADMETWKNDKDDLGDIAREMGKSADRLKNSKGGAETQKIQKDVLARLDKMIKDAQDAQDAAAKAAREAAEGKKDGAQQSPKPAEDTVPGQDRGLGEVDKKRVKELAEVWGKLPDKERAAAIRELVRKLPPKDRQVIENYLREIQKRSSK